jgi:hypothetical protein
MNASTIDQVDSTKAIDSNGPADELLEPMELMLKLYEESRRAPAYLTHDEDGSAKSSSGLFWSPERNRLSLPAPEVRSKPVHEAVVERTSIRHYAQRPVTQVQLATLLKTASEGDIVDWPDEAEAGMRLHFLVVAWRLEGITPAVYGYESSTHTLVQLGPSPDQRTEAVNMVLQVEFADAPVIILTVGDLARASALYGGWGHRQLLLRAGTAGQRLWLASIGLGLVGTVFAGFLQRAARRIAGVDGYRNAALFAYSTGHRRT